MSVESPRQVLDGDPRPGALRAEAVIDLGALRHNVSTLSRLVAPSEVMLAVKADAYGHGQLEISRAGLDAGAHSLAVLEIPAGVALRRAGVIAPLFAWLHGPHSDFAAAAEHDIELGISATWQLDAIRAAGASRPAVVHLKLDSGLSRNGARPEEWPALVDAALRAQSDGVVRLRGAWSHLADASVADDETALGVFTMAVETARDRGAEFEVLHLAASSAGIRMPEARFDIVRFGIAAYGISPFDDRSGADLGLRPVMTVRAPVLDVREGAAVLPIGYADGVATAALGQAQVLLDGERRRVREIGVDTMLVDTGPGASRGDIAVLFGEGADGAPTAEEWAGWAGTIGDEIVVHLGPRVTRRYVG
jgi:alanine racemase